MKDLSRFGDLRRVIIVDNSPHVYDWHPENAIGCTDFINDPNDRELEKIGDFMIAIKDGHDLREELSQSRTFRAKKRLLSAPTDDDGTAPNKKARISVGS